MAEQKWKRVTEGGSGLVKWSTIAAGYELEGTWLGTKPGKYGALGTLQEQRYKANGESDDGAVITFTLPYKLEARLKQVAEGSRIRIVYLGLVPTADPSKNMHDFDLFVIDDGTTPDDDTDEIPF